MKNLVEVKNIKKNYGKNEAVKGISFNIKRRRNFRSIRSKWLGQNNNDRHVIGTFKTN